MTSTNNTNNILSEEEFKESLNKMIEGAKKAVEIGVAMYSDEITKDMNSGINKVLDLVYKAFIDQGLEKEYAKPLVKIAFSLTLKENSLDIPEKFLKGILKDLEKIK